MSKNRSTPYWKRAALVATAFGMLSSTTALLAQQPPVEGLTFYSHGDPTDSEQYLLELINRARANPPEEGCRLAKIVKQFHPDLWFYGSAPLKQLKQNYASFPSRMPLAFNAALMTVTHSQLPQVADTSKEPYKEDFIKLLAEAGYNDSQWKAQFDSEIYQEKEYGYARSLPEGIYFSSLATLNTLKNSILNYQFENSKKSPSTEVGIATREGDLRTLMGFGTRAVTQATGVAFRDVGKNGFYLPGSGVEGILVTSPASHYYTYTSKSGGYALPLDQLPQLDQTHLVSSVQIVFTDPNTGQRLERDYPLSFEPLMANDSTYHQYNNVKADYILPSPTNLPQVSVITRTEAEVELLDIFPSCDGSLKRTYRYYPGKFVIKRQQEDLSQPLTVYYEIAGAARTPREYPDHYSYKATPYRKVVIPAGKRNAKVVLEPGYTNAARTLRLCILACNSDYQLSDPQSGRSPIAKMHVKTTKFQRPPQPTSPW